MRVLPATSALVLVLCSQVGAQPGDPAPGDPAPSDPAPSEPTATPADPDWLPGGRDHEEAERPRSGQPGSEQSRYPLALVERPLVLPSGSVQLLSELVLSRREFPHPSPPLETVYEDATELLGAFDARFAIDGFEIGTHLGVGLAESVPEEASANTLRTVGGDVAFGVTRDTAITALLNANLASKDYDRYAARLIVATKLRMTSSSAVVLGGRIGDNHLTSFERGGTAHPATDTVLVGADITLQAQLNPRNAFYARAFFGYYRELDADATNETLPPHETYLGSDYGIGFLRAAGSGIDLDVGMDLVATGSAYVQFYVALVLRRVP